MYHGVLRCMAKGMHFLFYKCYIFSRANFGCNSTLLLLYSMDILIGFPAIRKLWGIKKKQKGVLELVQTLAETDLTWWNVNHGRSGYEILSHDKVDEAEREEEYQFPSERPEKIKTTSPKETPLIAAARHGIVEIIESILDVYPQAIEHINDKDESIFHVAARCHRKEILDLLPPYALMPRLGRRINLNGDSILHQAAYLGETHHRDRPGDALRMQSDIQWFKVLYSLTCGFKISMYTAYHSFFPLRCGTFYFEVAFLPIYIAF